MNFLVTLKKAYIHWDKHHGSRLGAALAYYTVFCIVPLSLLFIHLNGFIFGENTVRNEVLRLIQNFMGKESAEFVNTLLQAAPSRIGMWAPLIEGVSLLFGSIAIFNELQSSLSELWELPIPKKQSWRQVLKKNIKPFSTLLLMGFFLLLSVISTSLLHIFQNYLQSIYTNIDIIFLIFNLLVSFGLLSLLFTSIYKILPGRHISWADAFVGALCTTLFFNLGRYLLQLYIAHSNILSSYGAASSLVLIIVWVYYSSQIFFFGASLTYIYSQRKTSHDFRELV